ncbi:MAG: hypothetical protein JW795_17810 [Chitinivibrionales bacterium]|nr:hypothetical protein [Chitinivibrionales bacterium]
MYEKPQFLTPGGLRRSTRNPGRTSLRQRMLMQKMQGSTSPLFSSNNGKIILSKKAAKLIALTIKGLLRK